MRRVLRLGSIFDAWTLATILVIALAVRVWWLLAVDTQPITDFAWYFDRAAEMAQGWGYRVDDHPTAYWPVGYPLALATVFKFAGASVLAGKVLNTALTLACVALTWVVARRLSPFKGASWIAALVVALHPAYIAYSGILASEPLFTALVLAGAATCLVCPRRGVAWMLGAGLAFGFATLVRPQAVLLPAIIIAVAAVWGNREALKGTVLQRLAWVYLVVGLVALTWTVRNYDAFGKFVFISTNGGDNLLIGHHPGANGRYKNPETIEPRLKGLNEVERDAMARGLALYYLRQDPGASLATVPAKVSATFLEGTDAAYWAFQTEKGRLRVPGMGPERSLFLAFKGYAQTYTAALSYGFGLALLAGFLGRKKGLTTPPLCTASVLYTLVLVAVFFGNPRFGFPNVPFLAVAVAHLVAGLASLARKPAAEGQPVEAAAH
ncbi:MAG: glycosyltransferase family 39 protein [Fimbriimonadaceae bacterium]|nr:MAG: glycosyltransferase family 39 protein [Fimbriimonadaceae bacterium]